MLVRFTSGLLLLAAVVSPKAQAFSFLPPDRVHVDQKRGGPDVKLFADTLEALQVMQQEYFQPWVGTWPSAIDWTAAVIGTHIAGALKSISSGLEALQAHGINDDFRPTENAISLYYTQLVGFYFGQDAFSLRTQAFDDMLWVVLGWLDTIHFVKDHDKSKYGFSAEPYRGNGMSYEGWHGTVWVPAFAHRARIFWHLAAVGWDTELCGGGMNWNPRLMPYKNAITNELYIAASISMYLGFPGDSNTEPFSNLPYTPDPEAPGERSGWKPRDPKYKQAAIDGYRWLDSSGMLNEDGLFADGFHISGYNSGSNNTKCDERDEMVYTYNQGVLLSGQRGLYLATGDTYYLQAGHNLIQNVIHATGWDVRRDAPVDDLAKFPPGYAPMWRGLGRGGILEEACDMKATCSQDAQTFKGIWMHHFTIFCAPLDPPEQGRGGSEIPRREHTTACRRYYRWLKHNADAARRTRDKSGRFGMWWTAGLLASTSALNLHVTAESLPSMDHAVDYRNEGVPHDQQWMFDPDNLDSDERPRNATLGSEQRPMHSNRRRGQARSSDLNDRGRGRTVETQSGGLALLRALWEISNLPDALDTPRHRDM
ncbi:hypothetical protein OQA88_4123 [Cercophora sp. LCS_1]